MCMVKFVLSFQNHEASAAYTRALPMDRFGRDSEKDIQEIYDDKGNKREYIHWTRPYPA